MEYWREGQWLDESTSWFFFSKIVGVDPPVPTQKPSRHSCSSARFVDLKNTQYTGPTRYSYSLDQQYSFHPFIFQFSTIFHPYITHVHDVRSDGNCGFRAIDVCLGLHEDVWPTIRYELMEELNRFKEEYVEMFGIGGWFNAYNSLNFFESNKSAPPEHWMTMPDMGVLVASNYNVILHVLSILGSIMHLPLRSNPPQWHQHVAIAIGHVNNNHYVKVTLTGGYPVPTITPQWIHFRHNCAAEWATPYFDRINIYNEYLGVRSNCTRKFVVLNWEDMK